MRLTPYEAFARFVELTPTFKGAFKRPSSDYRELLDAFLLNPDSHREQFGVMLEAYTATRLFELSGFKFFYGSMLRLLPAGFGGWKRYLERTNALKQQLLEEVKPGEFAVDVLPPRSVAAPTEWKANWDVHLLEMRVSVHPTGGLIPEAVSLKFTLDSREGRFIDCFPSTEFTEVGEYEIGLTSEAKFSRSASVGASLELGHGISGAKAGISAKAAAESQAVDTSSIKRNFKIPAKILKLVSSAVGKTVRWEILRTGDEPPTGGLTFLATLMVPKGTKSIRVTGSMVVELQDWGRLEQPVEETIKLAP